MSCNSPQRRAMVAIEADFFGQHAGQKGDFDRMPQHVLAVTGAEAQPAEQMDDFWMQAADFGFLDGFFAEFLDVLFHLGLRFVHDFFDPRGMNAAVGNQLAQRHTGDFAAHRIEAADDHHARRVVDDHVDAGGFFEGANVATFAADDAAFHFVVGNIDRAGGRFGRVPGGIALDGGDQRFRAISPRRFPACGVHAFG